MNRSKQWRVERRSHCKICGGAIEGKRYRTFCSKKCRTKSYTAKYRAKRSIWQRERMNARASIPSPHKARCMVCDRYYVQVGTHIRQRHFMTARQYREMYELPLKRGISPLWFRKLKGEQAIENKTFLNLLNGKRYWYAKGDKRAIKNTGYKGRAKEIKKIAQEIYPYE